MCGSSCFGFGLAGWMLPVGVIHEHTRAEHLPFTQAPVISCVACATKQDARKDAREIKKD